MSGNSATGPAVGRRTMLKYGSLGVASATAGCLGGGGDDGDGGSDGDGSDDGSGTGTTTTARTTGTPTLRFAFTEGTEISAPYPIYMQSSFFRSEVLPHLGDDYEISLTGTRGTSLAASGLGADEFDGALLAFASMASALAEDVVPSGLTVVLPFVWQLRSEMGFAEKFASLSGSGITDWADLEGVDFAVNAAGSGFDVVARSALRQHGLDPETDLNVREVSFGAMGTALREGRVDVGAFVQPLWEFVREDASPVFDFTEPFGNLLAFFGAFRDDYLAENPDVVRWFVEDNWRALQWLTDETNRSRALDEVSGHVDVERPTLEAALFDRGYYWSEDGYRMRPEFVQPGVDGMHETGYLDEPVDVGAHVDNSYLPEAADRVPERVLSD